MITDFLITVFGLLLLIVGGEVLLRGAVKLAQLFRLTPAVIGLTVVAAGTSVPELAVSAIAAWNGKMDIAVGNVVGSNICNIALILGGVALYRPLMVSGNTIKLEYPVMFLVTLLFVNLAKDGFIGRFDGILFVAIYVCFTAYIVRIVGKEATSQETAQMESAVEELSSPRLATLGPALFLTFVGICLLAYGADKTVLGASEIGRAWGMSERVIGLTIVAIGTSLPEFVTSLVSSYRGRNDIAIANVTGSNIFNILGILGVTALINPLSVAPSIIHSDSWWLLAITILIFPIMRHGFNISRKEGAFLLLFYLAYLVKLMFAS